MNPWTFIFVYNTNGILTIKKKTSFPLLASLGSPHGSLFASLWASLGSLRAPFGTSSASLEAPLGLLWNRHGLLHGKLGTLDAYKMLPTAPF